MMIQNCLLMVGLDGFDISFAEQLIDAGALPNIARLRLRSARFDLDHGLENTPAWPGSTFLPGCRPATVPDGRR